MHVTRHLEEALRGTDVITLLRVQKERLAGMKLRLDDYIARYQMTAHRLKMAKKDAIVMHPGPIIRGLELTGEVADGPQSVIVEEVRNGVPTRMAILARARENGEIARPGGSRRQWTVSTMRSAAGSGCGLWTVIARRVVRCTLRSG